MRQGWTNEAAIERWNAMPREAVERLGPDGDFAKRHLLNPTLLRMLGELPGRRLLDAGCGHGYLSRMLARAGATVVCVEPAAPLFEHAVAQEAAQPLDVRYVRADLCELPDLGPPFDACGASM